MERESDRDALGSGAPTGGSPAGTRSGRRRRWPWILLGVALAGAVGVRALLPLAIARGLEYALPQQIGLPLEVGNVDLWLLRGAVALEGVVLGGRAQAGGAEARAPLDREQALLRWQRIFARLDWRALLSHRVLLHELALESPVVRLVRLADGSLESPLPPTPPEPEEASPEPPADSAPWSFGLEKLQLSGAGLKIADAARSASVLDFSLEELSVTDLALEGEQMSLGAIGIRGPVLRVQQSLVLGGGAPPAEPAQAAAPAEGAPAAVSASPSAEPAPAPTAAPAPAFHIAKLSIERAVFTLLAATPLDVELHLEASGIGAKPGEPFPIELGLGLGGGEIALAGQLGLNPVSYEGKLRWHDLPVPLLSVAARPELASWIRSCRAEGDLDVSLWLGDGAAAQAAATGGGPGLRLAGRVAVHDFSLADPEQKEVALAFKELEIGVREAVLPLGPSSSPAAPTRIALEKIRLAAPAILYTTPAPALEALLGPQDAGADESPAEAPAEPPANASASPLELSVDALEVSSGSLRFADRSLSPPFQTEVKNLSLAVRELRWPGPRVQELRLRGVAPKQAAFALEGSLEPEAGQLSLQLDHLSLTPLDPYAGPAGYRIGNGEASLHTALRLRGQRYEVDNDLVLHRLALASTQPGIFEQTFGMPLDLALALLRDAAGDIQLPINLAYEGSTLATDLNATLAGALRQALAGVLAAPLKLVGAVLPTGEGPAELSLEPLPAVAGSAELAPGALERLEPFAEILTSRPMLGLVLRGRAGPADRLPLAEQILIERAQAEAPLPELEGAGLFARRRLIQALQAKGRGEPAELSPEDAALLAHASEAVSVPAERTAELERRRAEHVRDLLVQQKGIDPASLAIGEPAVAGEPAVEVELAARAG